MIVLLSCRYQWATFPGYTEMR